MRVRVGDWDGLGGECLGATAMAFDFALQGDTYALCGKTRGIAVYLTDDRRVAVYDCVISSVAAVGMVCDSDTCIANCEPYKLDIFASVRVGVAVKIDGRGWQDGADFFGDFCDLGGDFVAHVGIFLDFDVEFVGDEVDHSPAIN